MPAGARSLLRRQFSRSIFTDRLICSPCEGPAVVGTASYVRQCNGQSCQQPELALFKLVFMLPRLYAEQYLKL